MAMDVSKLPPSGLALQQPETPPSKDRLAGEIAAAISEDLEKLEGQAAPTGLDKADIRPLDIPGGLQILLAETRSAFLEIAESIGSSAGPMPGTGNDPVAAGPMQAARQIVEWTLQSLPDDASDAAVWTCALIRAETALNVGLQQAVNTVSAWRDVPGPVLETVQQSGALVLQVLSEELPNPLWLRPEWVGLAPRLERFSRRRLAARRRMTDPDHWQGNLDDNEEQRR
jgi:hypothetical protein